jgi:Plasmid pRiA4b ORF-3-like protein
VARTWLHIQVELEGGAGIECDPPPGRILAVGPAHSFLQLADAIDDAFARWDVAHLHAFELPGGRLVGLPGKESSHWLDHRTLTVADALAPGDRFTYTFDLAENWRHRCEVLEGLVDPLAEYGVAPRRPAIVWGWGWIPDQYGRDTEGEGFEPSMDEKRP